jgi:hypothetical protein
MLKVSVVVPVYNPGEYVRPCIDPLTSQMAVYFTRRASGLCLDVGLVKHRKLAAQKKPTAVPLKKPSFARRVMRRVRRPSARRPR